jgi:co-chaperonin GroES (HSP10)
MIKKQTSSNINEPVVTRYEYKNLEAVKMKEKKASIDYTKINKYLTGESLKGDWFSISQNEIDYFKKVNARNNSVIIKAFPMPKILHGVVLPESNKDTVQTRGIVMVYIKDDQGNEFFPGDCVLWDYMTMPRTFHLNRNRYVMMKSGEIMATMEDEGPDQN